MLATSIIKNRCLVKPGRIFNKSTISVLFGLIALAVRRTIQPYQRLFSLEHYHEVATSIASLCESALKAKRTEVGDAENE